MRDHHERGFETGYDPDSRLRLVRFRGNVDLDWLLERAPHDPTLEFLPDSVTLVDLQRARVSLAPSEVAELAAVMTKLVEPEFWDRSAWLVDRMETVGAALLFKSEMGAGSKVHWFTDEDAALAHLGVTADDLRKVTARLAPVEPAL